MARIYRSIAELVGNTPLVELTNYQRAHGLQAHILGKLEFLNPSGSVKDRLALALIKDGFDRGELTEGGTIIDVTSGNTGISFAAIGAAERVAFIPYLEPGTTVERVQIYQGYGLEIHDFNEIEEVAGFEEKGLILQDLVDGITRIAKENGYFYAGQTINERNQATHYETTGPEIWRDTDGQVDYFVAMGGTAGTIVGAGRYLREQNPEVKIVGVQAATSSRPDSPDFTGHIIDGTLPLGGVDESLLPPLIHSNTPNGFAFDEIIDISAERAYATAQAVSQTDGLFLGTSAAAALTAAIEIAARPEAVGKNIVVIYPDNGYKYLSTDLFKRPAVSADSAADGHGRANDEGKPTDEGDDQA
ncbi:MULTISPECIES: PLP-dependent cysteine synthase family protein [unclassified Actinobaculum]|uniref:PLP-dependent cysteine synthase family protein n=1 Tax=unclassified Actinobaculum TaxID=2609299 RepID=UPI000D525EF9|nr:MULTISPECIES: PLP-dependent cysteine synthase family protein [unclassified Actinobaculum]AWE41469.1 cysteine synthase [Actinobaculum sp. 313]RTE48178.1 PLP-dependent cysteine synthase family protein [Actinobaculum sp. 352]